MRLPVLRIPALVTCLVLFGSAAGHASAQDLSGAWRGEWNDARSGHHGPLCARLEKCDETHYRAVFTGAFWKVVPFRFTAVLTVTGKEGDKLLLSGSSNLGPFGTFTYSAWATECEFVADYSSCRWQGQFLLSR